VVDTLAQGLIHSFLSMNHNRNKLFWVLEEKMSSRKIFLILSFVALALLGLGCSKTAVEPEATIEEPNLTDEFGGYQPMNDEAGFGDSALQAEAEESEEEYDDPILVSAGLDSILNDAEAGLYHIRIVWGRLRYDSTSTIPTDWTGSLSVTRGLEILRRTIRFERNQDYIVPRKDRRVIEWVSQTTVHNDGIAVDIFVPPARPKIDTVRITYYDSLGQPQVEIKIDTTWTNSEPVMVEFKTSPYSRTFNLEELTSLDTIVYLDDSNAVAFHAIKLNRFPCPRGFLAGAWGFDIEGNGVFRGTWMDRSGHVEGYLKGHFGKNSNGELVFYGKWISREGRFEGFIRGHWGFYDCIGGDPSNPCYLGGFFRGRIFNSNREEIGVLAGQFRGANMVSNIPSGFFQGRWKLFCPGELTVERNSEEGFE